MVTHRATGAPSPTLSNFTEFLYFLFLFLYFYIPLFKGKGNRNNPDSYRGITLLNIGGKIFTKVLTERLDKWIVENNILIPEQAGFRQGYSPVDNLFVLNAIVERQSNKPERQLFCCLVDFLKAFDAVPKEALWYKLEVLGLPDRMTDMLKELYKNTDMRVLIGQQTVSESFETK